MLLVVVDETPFVSLSCEENLQKLRVGVDLTVIEVEGRQLVHEVG